MAKACIIPDMSTGSFNNSIEEGEKGRKSLKYHLIPELVCVFSFFYHCVSISGGPNIFIRGKEKDGVG